MKKIKIITFILIIAGLISSCENDGGTSFVPLNDGAVPNMQKSATGESIIDLVKINNNEPVNLEFSAEIAQGNPASADIVAVYQTIAGPVYYSVLFSDVTLPMDVTMSTDDIVGAFAEINNSSDIKLGDVLFITTRFTMPDGTVLNILNEDGTSNTGSNIQTTVLFTTVISYPVSCPTMLEGNYTSTVVASNLSIPANFISPQQVTITQPSAGTYVLNDGTAGIFGAATPIGLQFTDVCGTITVATQSTSFPGQVDFDQGNGTNLDPVTGIITLELAYTSGSCCGLPGITYTLELVPN
ncbi:hypothetical protein J8L88_15585 [Aquimarina sp. MMG015]|uniref:hypothetical protein n=1 Tax=unclassified Aquimarina TaxID=2627091 RepID=UPI000D557B64|nr:MULTISPECIES: hypothetical protein [unclassified Aquimarina]MBQ4804285.1 hypothetical protein [Aquimarina sp. MMG015]